jgi:hypothetical protein
MTVTRLARSVLSASAVALAAPAMAAEPLASYPETGGTFLPFYDAPPPGEPLRAPPTLDISFGGRNYRAVVDTGSTGIVVAASMIPGFDSLPNQGEGKLVYTSSGRVMHGSWVTTPVRVSGADGSAVKTAAMTVLAVTQVTCLENARDCMPLDAPEHIAMLGIGFGREHDDQPQSTPDKNPLLQVAGRGRAGYVVSREGLWVSLSRQDVGRSFTFAKLERGSSDWQAMPVCISLKDVKPSACGTLLMDTGVGRSFLTVPDGQISADVLDDRRLPDGTNVTVSEPSGKPILSYTVGDRTNPVTPSEVIVRLAPEKTFINTSFHFLNAFDYLYDAEGGYVGYRGVDAR